MAETTTPAPLATPAQVADYRTEQQKEWGEYVAVTSISVGGVLAYNVGDPVPVSNVERHKYDEQGLVAKVSTVAGKKTIAELHEAAQAQPSAEVYEPVSLNVSVAESKK